MVEQWVRLIARWDEEEFDRGERKGRKAVAPRSYEGPSAAEPQPKSNLSFHHEDREEHEVRS